MKTIPKIKEIYDNIISDIETQFGITIPEGKSVFRTISAVWSAIIKICYLYLGDVQKNIFVDTADSELLGGTLERFGRVKIGRDPFPPTSSQYNVTITGSIGAVIPASTTLKSDDTALNPSILFVVDNDYTLVSTTDTLVIRCLESGLIGKLNILDTLTFTAPIALVNKSVTVDSVLVEPKAAETIEEYRNVVLQSYRLEPQGGAAIDYRLWSLDVQGLRTSYPYRSLTQTSELDIFVESNLIDSTDGKGTPTPLMLTQVSDVIELDPDINKPINLRGRRPLGVFNINILPILLRNVDIEIVSGTFTPDEKTLIENTIIDVLYKIRPFIVGADILTEKNDILNQNKIIVAILTVLPTAQFLTINLKVDNVITSSFAFVRGDIPTLNTITYV